jgi:hypothetical protein
MRQCHIAKPDLHQPSIPVFVNVPTRRPLPVKTTRIDADANPSGFGKSGHESTLTVAHSTDTGMITIPAPKG